MNAASTSRKPGPAWLPALVTATIAGTVVGIVAGQFTFDPVGRQIAWIGSSFTLTATCVAYVIQERRRVAYEERQYQAIVNHNRHRGASD